MQNGKANIDLVHFRYDQRSMYEPYGNESILSRSCRTREPDMIGSTHRLHQECVRLAEALKLPMGLDPESEVVDEAMQNGEGDALWQRYGIESYTCLQLLRASEHSMKTGALIVFC